ncbi:hypothetical protein GPJ56_002891 [Histomonas meleagridis]|uniref:uncharacterized protein n=1 Tax=Histomonas meleagridis TaxID=135588 RepID=UPI00355AB6C2|nr:hypothetical protein GPJ56_002891 [Histomonas meleagridis]KAH0800408.1 hypothetical protein GO595_006819 [Histomonas meleagridis]
MESSTKSFSSSSETDLDAHEMNQADITRNSFSPPGVQTCQIRGSLSLNQRNFSRFISHIHSFTQNSIPSGGLLLSQSSESNIISEDSMENLFFKDLTITLREILDGASIEGLHTMNNFLPYCKSLIQKRLHDYEITINLQDHYLYSLKNIALYQIREIYQNFNNQNTSLSQLISTIERPPESKKESSEADKKDKEKKPDSNNDSSTAKKIISQNFLLRHQLILQSMRCSQLYEQINTLHYGINLIGNPTKKSIKKETKEIIRKLRDDIKTNKTKIKNLEIEYQQKIEENEKLIEKLRQKLNGHGPNSQPFETPTISQPNSMKLNIASSKSLLPSDLNQMKFGIIFSNESSEHEEIISEQKKPIKKTKKLRAKKRVKKTTKRKKSQQEKSIDPNTPQSTKLKRPGMVKK